MFVMKNSPKRTTPVNATLQSRNNNVLHFMSNNGSKPLSGENGVQLKIAGNFLIIQPLLKVKLS